MKRHMFFLIGLLMYASQVHASCTVRKHIAICKGGSPGELAQIPDNITELVIKDMPLNRITMFTFSSFKTTLKKLSCINCNISVIIGKGFTGFKSLENLSLRHNNLTALNGHWFQDVDKLRKIDFNYNSINKCVNIDSMSALDNIRHIRVRFNPYIGTSCTKAIRRLTHGHCDPYPNKKYVCNNVSLRDIQKIPSDIHDLEVNDSPLKKNISFIFSRFADSLKRLQCNNCNISKIEDDAFRGFKSLQRLYLQSNKLAILNASSFKDLENLVHLDLSMNNVSSCANVGQFLTQKQLKHVDVRSNPHLERSCMDAISPVRYGYCEKRGVKYVCEGIVLMDTTELPDDVSHLEIRDTPINRITSSTFSRFQHSLESLSCINCNITDIEYNAFSGFKKLSSINVEGNQMSKLNAILFEYIENLEELNVNRNNISSCVNMQSLIIHRRFKYVFVEHNPNIESSCWTDAADINQGTCKGFSPGDYVCNGGGLKDIEKIPDEVYRLEINNIPIKCIDSATFSRFKYTLKYFKCRGCSISDIQDNIFGEFRDLERLILPDNKLESIKGASFNDNDKLWELNLNNNNIDDMDSDLFLQLPALELLHVSNNIRFGCHRIVRGLLSTKHRIRIETDNHVYADSSCMAWMRRNKFLVEN